MDMTKALKRHKQVGERAGVGGGLEGTKGRGWPSEGRDEEGGEQALLGNRWRGGQQI